MIMCAPVVTVYDCIFVALYDSVFYIMNESMYAGCGYLSGANKSS